MSKNQQPRVVAAASQPGGWFEVLPRATMGQRGSYHSYLTVVWLVALSTLAGWQRPDYTHNLQLAVGWYLLAVAGAGLTWCPWTWLRMTLLNATLREARVFLDREKPILGEPFLCLVDQPFRRSMNVQLFEARLVCRCKELAEFTNQENRSSKAIVTNTCWDQTLGGFIDYKVAAGESITVQDHVSLSENLMPSSSPKAEHQHQYEWVVLVKTEIQFFPDYRAEFPLFITKKRKLNLLHPENTDPQAAIET